MNSDKRTLQDYMALPYTTILRKDEDGDVIARIKEFEGCVAHGQDETEALANLERVRELWLTSCFKSSRPIPLPEEEQEFPSGKWLQRVPRSLHAELVALAERERTSLNQLVTSMLSLEVGRRASGAQLGVTNLDAVATISRDRWDNAVHQLVTWHTAGPSQRPSSASSEHEFVLHMIQSVPKKVSQRTGLEGSSHGESQTIWDN